jgi:hypothetical protein
LTEFVETFAFLDAPAGAFGFVDAHNFTKNRRVAFGAIFINDETRGQWPI